MTKRPSIQGRSSIHALHQGGSDVPLFFTIAVSAALMLPFAFTSEYFMKVKGYPAMPRTIGEAIRKRRLDLGLRQIDVARIIGCNQMSIVNSGKGYNTPAKNKMSGIRRFLGDD